MRRQEVDWLTLAAARLVAPKSLERAIRVYADPDSVSAPSHHVRRFEYCLEALGGKVMSVNLHAPGAAQRVALLPDANRLARLHALHPGVVVCCDAFRTVSEPAALARMLEAVAAPGSVILCTAALDAPPVDGNDTGFRPTPGELAGLFSVARLATSDVIGAGTFWRDLRQIGTRRGSGPAPARLLDPQVWLRNIRYLARPYRFSCAALMMPAAAPAAAPATAGNGTAPAASN